MDYYETMAKETFAADFDKTRGQVRLFMFPGMAHCSGGPGPGAPEDLLLRRLQEWVEGGKPPDYVIATTGRTALSTTSARSARFHRAPSTPARKGGRMTLRIGSRTISPAADTGVLIDGRI